MECTVQAARKRADREGIINAIESGEEERQQEEQMGGKRGLMRATKSKRWHKVLAGGVSNAGLTGR